MAFLQKLMALLATQVFLFSVFQKENTKTRAKRIPFFATEDPEYVFAQICIPFLPPEKKEYISPQYLYSFFAVSKFRIPTGASKTLKHPEKGRPTPVRQPP